MIEYYPYQFEPHDPFCDLVLMDLDIRDRGHVKEHLAPIGDKNYIDAHSNLMTLDRINLVEEVFARIMS